MTAINLEDELVIDENPWRGRIITLVVLGLITAGVVAAIWYFTRDESVSVSRRTEEIPAKMGTINQTLSITGISEAQLSSNLTFQTAGKVSAVNARVGDTVTSGQVLASLESEDLANAVQVAQSQAFAAQLKLQDLLGGADAGDLRTADQAVTTAQTTLLKAQNDYNDLADGVTAAETAAAQQLVSAAEAQLATARGARDKLVDGATAADIAGAEASVEMAQSALTAAENSEASAGNSVTTVAAALKAAESNYCGAAPVPSPEFCPSGATPVSGGDMNLLESALSGANASLASATIAANSAYLNAQHASNSAEAAVASAQQSLAAAQAKLAALNEGASTEDLATADAAIASGEAALGAAREKLVTLQEGATPYELSDARAAIDSAAASLTAAEAKRRDAYRGADANELGQARQALTTAQLQVAAAEIRLKNAQIIAPFDGVVGAVNIKPGEFSGSSLGGGASATGGTAAPSAPIVLLTPDRMALKMSVGETDYRGVKVGQAGVAIFDGIPGKPYPFTIQEIGLNPVVNQGVVTYDVKAEIIILPDSPRPAPGMNARGQLTTESKPNILVVPPRAIRLRGTEQIVDVKRNNAVEEVVVTTGVTDNEQVEILSGLIDGDIILVASLVGADGAEPTVAAAPTLPGGVR